MAQSETHNIHATCIALLQPDVAVPPACLLIGASGAGKSSLALCMISTNASATAKFGLVADDRTDICVQDGAVLASPPDALQGKIEVRGLGVMSVPHISKAQPQLVINLVARDLVPRHPGIEPPETRRYDLLGTSLPMRALHAFDTATPHAIALALKAVASGQLAE